MFRVGKETSAERGDTTTVHFTAPHFADDSRPIFQRHGTLHGMKPLQREIVRFLLVLLIALTARMAFVIWWQRTHITHDQQFEFPDSQSYWELGQHLARGEPYQFGSADLRVARAPGYPLI